MCTLHTCRNRLSSESLLRFKMLWPLFGAVALPETGLAAVDIGGLPPSGGQLGGGQAAGHCLRRHPIPPLVLVLGRRLLVRTLRHPVLLRCLLRRRPPAVERSRCCAQCDPQCSTLLFQHADVVAAAFLGLSSHYFPLLCRNGSKDVAVEQAFSTLRNARTGYLQARDLSVLGSLSYAMSAVRGQTELSGCRGAAPAPWMSCGIGPAG